VATGKACCQMNADKAEELHSDVMGILRSAGVPKPNLTKMEAQVTGAGRLRLKLNLVLGLNLNLNLT